MTRCPPIITDYGAINQRFETSVNLEAGAKPTIHGITHPGIPLLRRAHQQGKDPGKGVRRTCQVEKLALAARACLEPWRLSVRQTRTATLKWSPRTLQCDLSSPKTSGGQRLVQTVRLLPCPRCVRAKLQAVTPQQVTCGDVVSRSLLSGQMAILCVELRYKGTSRLQKERKHHRTRTSSCFPRLISRRDVSPSEMMAPLVCGHTP